MVDLIDETVPLHVQLGQALLLSVSHAYDRATAAGNEEWQARCVDSMRKVNDMLNQWGA